MCPELALMVDPRAAYASLARRGGMMGPLTALRRPLLAAVVLGVAVAIAGTGHVTPTLAVSTTLMWSYLVAAQVVIAVALIARDARRTVGLWRAIDLFFAAHAPWSLFALAACAWSPSPVGRPVTPLLVAALVPVGLTPRILVAFFAEVLRLDPRRAIRRTMVHQAVTWGLFAAAFWIVNALSPRALALIR